MSSMIVTFPGGKRVDAEHHGFTIRTDQPPKGGGEGSAPQPFDLFLASIATCAGIYVKGYCDTRQIPTENLGIEMHVERDEDAPGREARPRDPAAGGVPREAPGGRRPGRGPLLRQEAHLQAAGLRDSNEIARPARHRQERAP